MRFAPSLARVAILTSAVAIAIGAQVALTAGPSAPSSIITVDPARILDTRTGVGAPVGPVGANSTITLQVTGAGGVPAGATGVVLTLTATGATASTFITAWPTGSSQPNASVLNPPVAQSVANTMTLPLGTGGAINLYNSLGSVHLIADVSGYLLPATGGPTPPTTLPPTTLPPTTVPPTTAPSGPTKRAVELNAYNAFTTGTVTYAAHGCLNLGTNGEIALDVPLPHGSAPTKVTFRWYDTNGANIIFGLSETAGGFPGTPAGSLGGAQSQSTGTAGYGSTSIEPTGADTVSASVRYHIIAFTPGLAGGGGAHFFCGATVEYDQL